MIRKLISFLCNLCNIQKFIVFNFINLILFVTILCILYKEKPSIHSEINTIKKNPISSIIKYCMLISSIILLQNNLSYLEFILVSTSLSSSIIIYGYFFIIHQFMN